MIKVEVIYLWKADLKEKPELDTLKEHTARYDIPIYKAEDIGPRLKGEIDLILKTYHGIRSVRFYMEVIPKPVVSKLKPTLESGTRNMAERPWLRKE